jgi:hypothetical protein
MRTLMFGCRNEKIRRGQARGQNVQGFQRLLWRLRQVRLPLLLHDRCRAPWLLTSFPHSFFGFPGFEFRVFVWMQGQGLILWWCNSTATQTMSAALIFEVFIKILQNDGLLALASIGMVFTYVWIVTGSLFLAMVSPLALAHPRPF